VKQISPVRPTLFVAALCLALFSSGAAQARGGGVQLKVKPARPKATALVTFSGRAGSKAGKHVTVQRRTGGRWKTIAKGRTGKRGKYALTWITPSKRAQLKVRASVGGRASKAKHVRVRARAKGAPKIRVSKKTRIISPSTVRSVPDPGEPGKVTYAGGNDIHKGAIVVVGQGPDTPSGFLGRVTQVDQGNGKTVAETVPATLLQAVPQGSVKLSADKVSTRSQTRAAKVTCEGSAGFSVTPDVTFSAGLDFAGAWGSNLFSGPVSASVTASASLNASVEAAVSAAGSCSLGERELLKVKGPSVSGFVGPVPIVMTSDLTVYLDASAGVGGKFATSASAGFDASAGVAWTKANGFSSTQSFEPHFDFQPPELSANANVDAHLTPTIDVLLYGIAGPRVALQTGVEFAADTTQDPWWTLSIPVNVTGSIAIPALDLESPKLDIYSRSFPLADAGGKFGAPPPPPPAPVHNDASPLTSLAVGFGHSCALHAGGTVACWGRDNANQLGNGAAGASNVPSPVSGITTAAAIAAGEDHTCALLADGRVKCWGDNSSGQLGNGKKTASAIPVDVINITNATALALGTSHSCALLGTGKVTCWGANDQHQMGNGGTGENLDPKYGQVPGISGATAITAGYRHSCAVLSSGSISCWGSNDNGQLGNGTNASATGPVTVNGVTNGVLVAAGIEHTCALRFDETVACWGLNSTGELGSGTRDDSFSPVGVANLGSATALGLGWEHSCAVVADGTIQCWGDNEYGQRGNGSTGRLENAISPVVGINDAKGVEAGSGHTCALRASGAVACWGYGLDGELGNGQSKSSSVPVAVTGFPGT
jgi:alpha-tubulin suppressor-like RCC1 family protein